MSDTAEKFVAMVKPTTHGSGSHDALLDMLPPGIRTETFYCGIKDGTVEEFKTVMPEYERGVAEMAAQKPDMIPPEGTPPFMLHGYEGEQRIVKGWEDRYGIPVFTSGMNQIRALRAVGAKRIVGSGYDSITGPIVEDYFRDAGFDVVKIEKAPFTWEQTGELTDDEMIDYLVSVYRRFPGGEAMYIQGSKWPSMRVVDRLEKLIGVPVVQAVTARCWEIQVRCGILRPQSGYGVLLEKMPQG